MGEEMGKLYKLPEDIELEKLKRLDVTRGDGKLVNENNKGKALDIKNLQESKERKEFYKKFYELQVLVSRLIKELEDKKDERLDYNLLLPPTLPDDEEEIINLVKNYDEKKVTAELFFYNALIGKIIAEGKLFPLNHY